MTKLVVDATGNDLTYRIIGAAMEVHNNLGTGYKEEVYEKALEVELNKADISVLRQFPAPVEYQGEQVAVFYLDLLVEGQVVVASRPSRLIVAWDYARHNPVEVLAVGFVVGVLAIGGILYLGIMK